MSHQWTRSARARSLTLALFAALGVLSCFVARAEAVPLSGSANPLPGSSFEGGDADQEASNPLRTDWASPGVNPVSGSPDPNANDNIFAGGAEGKENNPGNWNFRTQDGGSTPGKNNILDAYTHTPAGSGDVFLDLAFTRANATGTTYMAFELNKRADLWNNGKVNIPCRTTGDIIVSYQVSGNSPDVILQKWTSTTSDAATGCAKTGTLTDYVAVVDNVNAQGAVNAAPIQNYLASSYPWPGNVIPAGLFGEASLNLTSLLSGALGTPCFSFGSIWMHTRASTSDSSNLDDYIAPRPLLVRNCSASGTKFHDLDGDGARDAGEPGLAGFRIWADYDEDGVRDAGEPFADTNANGHYVITNLQDPIGTYAIREQLTAGAGTGGWTCSYPASTAAGGAFPCAHTGIVSATTPNVTGKDFGNHRPAVVKVEKQTVPDGATDAFAFTSTIPGKGSFDLTDGGVETATVAPGTYTATEALHPDYDLTGVACSDADSTGAGQAATFRAQSGETVTCTFTNTRKTGKLTVRKILDPANDPGTFDLSIGNDLVVDDGGNLAAGSRTLPTGSGYTVSEAAGAGTSLAKYASAIECRDGDTVVKSGSGTSLAGVPVIQGRDVVCTFTNERRKGSITVIKDLVPATDGGTFDLRVGDQVVKAAAGDGDQGTTDVAPGTYGVSETGAAGYDSAIACRKNGEPYKAGAGTSLGGLDVDSNDAIVCTITNVRLGSVTVAKTEGGKDPGRTWTFRLTGGPDNVSITRDTAADGSLGFGSLKPGQYTLCEIDLPAGWHSSLGEDACVDLTIEPGETEAVAVDNTMPATLVIKEGNAFVHHGDTITYTFDVSNAGNTPLKDVSVEDGRCDAAPVRDAANDENDDGDALLEAGEVWRFTCAKVVDGDHAGAEENPIVNVATARAVDEDGNEVTDTDDHTTTIIHPGIAVNKELRRLGDGGYRDGDAGDAPLPVHRGDTIQYRFTVTNTGDTPLAVAFSDPKCDTQPAGPEAGDANGDGKLDTGETWTYRCSHLVADADADPLDNTVTVTGTDRLGGDKGTVTAKDTERADIARPDIAVDKQVRRLGLGAFVDEGLQAHLGDTLEYRMAVTDGDSDTPITGVELADPRCDAGTLSGPVKSGGDDDELLEDGETWTYTCTHVITDTDPDPLPNTATATGRDTVGCPDVPEPGDCGEVEDEDATSVELINPKTLVVKEGNQFAYPGDTVTFTFAVTNAGDTPLHDVAVTDDRCAPVTGPTEKRGGDADDLLDPGETWMFTCAKQIPADHKIGDENPIRNVATATGKDPLDKPVTSTDDHLVRVLHPAIDIEKTGPGTAAVGAPLAYTLTVTNPGDVPFAAQDVVVADPRCEAPPAGPATGADQTPGQLDPGDTWTYTCTAQTTGQPAGSFVNTATVTAKDFNGRGVSDTDAFPTVLVEEQGVLPGEIISGFARLRGPSGCVKQAFNATVRGRRIARVTFYVDGEKRKRIVAERGQRVFRVKVRPGSAVGVHRVTARVVFKASSRTKARTLRLSYRRCVRQVVTPQFTG